MQKSYDMMVSEKFLKYVESVKSSELSLVFYLNGIRSRFIMSLQYTIRVHLHIILAYTT